MPTCPQKGVYLSRKFRDTTGNCLKIDINERFSKEALEAQLLGCLRRLDRNTFETLLVTLNYFDEIAAESEEGGWPYYEDRVEKLNEAFSDSSPL